MEQYAGVAALSGVTAIWYELFEVMGVGSFRRQLGVDSDASQEQLSKDFPGGIPAIMKRSERAQTNQVE